MWICPKCGREFKRTNQAHYCGKAPETVLEYIESLPSEIRPNLIEMMNALQQSVPNIKERIVWSMPYYEKEGKSISFSACKKHISFYVGVEAIEEFASELNDFDTKKSAIYFPYDKALPVELITKMVTWCLN
ncbi:iron chaperone [[Eubacterium] hominis]|uniref:iron chaperone n=1 Tax=[Eubacterium] hominis TaxID=2764325 RepID=UPI003A4E15AC